MYDPCKKKIRGVKRQMRTLDAWKQSLAKSYPESPDRDGNWWSKLPINSQLVRGLHARRGIKRRIMITMLQACDILREQKPSEHRVVALIDPNDLFRASIDVFFDHESYRKFVVRPGEEGQWSDQSWVPLPQIRSLLREWNLSFDITERGYSVLVADEEGCFNSEIWLIGDVD